MPARVLDERPDAGAAPVDAATLADSARRALDLVGLSRAAFSVVLIDDARMSDYNRQYRGKDGPTNALSFPAEAPPGAPAALAAELGDVLVSVDTARREAEAAGVPLARRLVELMLHGLLHLAGYDHERSEAEAVVMWEKEQALSTRLLAATRREEKNMPQLSVNIDHVATLRQARGGAEPDPVLAAGICELAGARGIVAHLREDRRHVQDRDARLLRQMVKTHFNLEMAATKDLLDFAAELRPDMVTLVPEKRRELTTEGGLDVAGLRRKLGPAVRALAGAGIEVSLFVDPEAGQIEAAAALGASHVELHTGRYADAESAAEREREFAHLCRATELALEIGLLVKAGHGLDYRNVGPVAGIPGIGDLSIGHAVIGRAAFVGLDVAVREMLAAIRAGAARQADMP